MPPQLKRTFSDTILHSKEFMNFMNASMAQGAEDTLLHGYTKEVLETRRCLEEFIEQQEAIERDDPDHFLVIGNPRVLEMTERTFRSSVSHPNIAQEPKHEV